MQRKRGDPRRKTRVPAGFEACTLRERSVFRRLNSPAKIQVYLDSLRYNHERHGDTCRSPCEVIRHGESHCIEGALFAAACLEYHGKKPLIVDLEAEGDYDHVICVFKEGGLWGCISKSNFHSLGYRDAIHRNIRELALTYFASYNNYRGQKTLRRYSIPINMKRFNDMEWRTRGDNLWEIGTALFDVKHYALFPKRKQATLRTVPLAAQYADTAKPPKHWKNRKPVSGN